MFQTVPQVLTECTPDFSPLERVRLNYACVRNSKQRDSARTGHDILTVKVVGVWKTGVSTKRNSAERSTQQKWPKLSELLGNNTREIFTSSGSGDFSRVLEISEVFGTFFYFLFCKLIGLILPWWRASVILLFRGFLGIANSFSGVNWTKLIGGNCARFEKLGFCRPSDAMNNRGNVFGLLEVLLTQNWPKTEVLQTRQNCANQIRK